MGGAMDVQYVMNLLPANLFPRNERVVEEFMCAGFSMGGEFSLPHHQHSGGSRAHS